ncbi:MAG: DUF1800 domain-containing protein [Acidimicrobiia bacterium]
MQTRRRFSTAGLAALAGAVGLGACRAAAPAAPDAPGGTVPTGTGSSDSIPNGPVPVADAPDVPAGMATAGSDWSPPADRAVHVANRLTFGLTPEVLAAIRQAGVAVWVDEQLQPDRHVDPPELTATLAALPTLQLDAAELAGLLGDGGSRPASVAAETVAATIARQRWRSAQLHEVMVEFWTNHFAMDLFSGPLRVLKPFDDREVVRPHAVGRFADLLAASAQSPAMLVSLDNARSRAGAINENYGRELLELHTVGVDGGFTEADVVAAANTLTGFTVERGSAHFTFDPSRHDERPQQVLDWRTPAGLDGHRVGLSLLDHLAHHPATARHLATKLAIRFVSDEPDPGLVATLAEVYLANDTAIDAVLRALVADERFFTTATAKFRRPHELLLAALRGLDGGLDAAKAGALAAPGAGRTDRVGGFGAALRSMGQLPMSWPSPDGFPDVAAAWRNPGALLTRWNTLADLVAGELTPAHVDLGRLLGAATLPAGPLLDAVADRVFGIALTAGERDALLSGAGVAVDTPVATGSSTARTLVALLLATPRFQYR